MKREGEQTLLRVFLKNTDKVSWWTNTQVALLGRAIRRQLAGATTLEGVRGLVGGEPVDRGRWALVRRRPVVLEFLDSPWEIGGFLADLVETAPHALATLERARVLAYRRRADEAARAAERLAAPGRPEPGAYLPDPEEFPVMRAAVDGQVLRIFIDDADTYRHRPLYQAVLDKARECGLSNAVVLRAAKGFGTHRRLHTDSSPDYDAEAPVLIEVVGTPREIDRLLPFLDEAVPEGLITLEGVTLLLPRARPPEDARGQ